MGWSPTVAHASGSERCVLLSVSLLLSFPCFSVKFRVNPWLILLLILGINSVANAYS